MCFCILLIEIVDYKQSFVGSIVDSIPTRA
jgi:hypothetical protein